MPKSKYDIELPGAISYGITWSFLGCGIVLAILGIYPLAQVFGGLAFISGGIIGLIEGGIAQLVEDKDPSGAIIAGAFIVIGYFLLP